MGKYTIELSKSAKKHLKLYEKSGDENSKKRIEHIFIDLSEHPQIGVGSPEELKYGLNGFWSRKINKKDRLIYKIDNEIITVTVISAKGHYDDK
jgi:toxin YoeB